MRKRQCHYVQSNREPMLKDSSPTQQLLEIWASNRALAWSLENQASLSLATAASAEECPGLGVGPQAARHRTVKEPKCVLRAARTLSQLCRFQADTQ